MIKILIADDHKIIIDGIRAILDGNPDIEIVGEASNGKQILDILNIQMVDIIIMDIEMPLMNGIIATENIVKNYSPVKILIQSMHNKPEYIKKLKSKGVSGYILKESGKRELLKAIKIIAEGGKHFSQEVINKVFEDVDDDDDDDEDKKIKVEAKLTEREKEVLRYLSGGNTTKQIAYNLKLETSTIDTYRRNLLAKSDCNNTAELIIWGIRKGFLK